MYNRPYLPVTVTPSTFSRYQSSSGDGGGIPTTIVHQSHTAHRQSVPPTLTGKRTLPRRTNPSTNYRGKSQCHQFTKEANRALRRSAYRIWIDRLVKSWVWLIASRNIVRLQSLTRIDFDWLTFINQSIHHSNKTQCISLQFSSFLSYYQFFSLKIQLPYPMLCESQ